MCYHFQRREALTEREHDTVAREADDEREAAIEREEFAEEDSPERELDDSRPEPIGLA
ncbi:hypothetical protein [Halobellus sp. GM3]|uniref:hypothetical protein n=1 Tax=Halobellus sp. GM3 TaxID=3458410 RepID=UPI00403E12BE